MRMLKKRRGHLSVIFTVVAVVASGLFLTACKVPPPGGDSLTITTFSDYTPIPFPGGVPDLNNSGGSPQPGILVGRVNSCMNINSKVPGRHALCRVVDGYDQWQYDHKRDRGGALYDHRNWDIQIIGGHPQMVAITRYNGVSISTYATPKCQGNGCAGNGAANMFEGCVQIASWDGQWPPHSAETATDHFVCEFSVFNHVITTHNSSSAWDQIASNAWPFFRHSVVGAAACAFGLMGLTAGIPLILKILGTSDCWEEVHP